MTDMFDPIECEFGPVTVPRCYSANVIVQTRDVFLPKRLIVPHIRDSHGAGEGTDWA